MAEAPQFLGKWLIHRPLGRGAFGLTFLAEDSTKTGVYGVIKFLTGSPLTEPIEITKARFEREREILSTLNNQHVCKLLDDDLESEPPWIVIDYLPGKPLDGLISEDYTLDEAEWFRLASDMLNGLAYLHSKKIIHRDLNPANILATNIGYKIIDFGISYKQGLPKVTLTNLRHLFYASPEQLEEKGKVTTKSDIFTLATLLVFAGTHRSPWSKSPDALTDKATGLVQSEIVHNTVHNEANYHSLSANQKKFLGTLHAKNPSERPTAQEALELLKSYATHAFLNPVEKSPHIKTVESLTSQKSDALNNSANRKARVVVKKPPVIKREVSNRPVVPPVVPVAKAPVKKIEPKVTKAKNGASEVRNLKIWYLVVHGISGGLFTPLLGIPIARKVKRRRVTIFSSINLALVVLLFIFGSQMQENETTPSFATSMFSLIVVVNYIYGFFLPIFLRVSKVSAVIEDAAEVTEDKPENQPAQVRVLDDAYKIDPSDNEDYLADAFERIAKGPETQTWETLRVKVREVLDFDGIDRFSIEFSRDHIAGIYFQGFKEVSGCVTIEASANLSVRPELTSEQNRNIIKAGWEPPTPDNPNYVKFLDLTQSNFDYISELVVTTLRDGYGVRLAGLEPVFKVGIGGEVEYMNFEDFKALIY